MPPAGTDRVVATVIVPNPATPGHGWHIKVEGEPLQVGDAQVVVDHEYRDAPELAATIAALLGQATPTLRRALRELVVPKMMNPQGLAAGSANRASGQVILWEFMPDLPPRISRSTLEHELAHLMFEDGGPPDLDEWRAAMEADQEHGTRRGEPRGLLVDQDIPDVYEPSQHVPEDWAYSVQYALAADRAASSTPPGEAWWREAYPHRSAIIDRVLGA